MVLSVALLYLRSFKSAQAQWWDDRWHYRLPVSITYSGTTQLTNFQVKLASVDTTQLVTDGTLQNDCSDIRFTNTTGKLLDHWIADISASDDLLDCSANDYDIWVKVDKIDPGGSTIYMYYGNPSAESASNGQNTFEFFDQFDGSSVDTGTKWTASGTPTVSAGAVSVDNAEVLVSKTAPTDASGLGKLVFRAKQAATNLTRGKIGFSNTSSTSTHHHTDDSATYNIGSTEEVIGEYSDLVSHHKLEETTSTDANQFKASGYYDTGKLSQGLSVYGNAAGTTGSTLTFNRGAQISGNNYEHLNTNQGTLSFWVKPNWDGDDNKYHVLFTSKTFGTSSSFSIYKSTGDQLIFRMEPTEGKTDIEQDVTSLITSGNWYHVVVRWDADNTISGSNTLDMWMNNSQYTSGYRTTSTWTTFAPNSQLSVGADPDGTDSGQSLIDDFTIFDRVLTTSEITSIYNSGTGREAGYVADPSLKFYAKLDGSGTLSPVSYNEGSSAAKHQAPADSGLSGVANLVNDALMEEAGTTDWTGGGTLSKSTSTVLYDAQSMSVVMDANGEGLNTSPNFSLTGGNTYYLEYWYKGSNSSTNSFRFYLYDYTEGTGLPGTGTQLTLDNNWRQFEINFQVPGTGTHNVAAWPVYQNGADTTPTTVFIDNYILTPNSVNNGGMEGTYTDGTDSDPGTTDLAPNWTAFQIDSGGTDNIEVSTDEHTGTNAQQINVDALDEGVRSTAYSTTSGNWYLLSGWLKVTSGTARLRTFATADGSGGCVITTTSASYTKLACIFEANNTQFMIEALSHGGAVNFLVDDVSIIPLDSVATSLKAWTPVDDVATAANDLSVHGDSDGVSSNTSGARGNAYTFDGSTGYLRQKTYDVNVGTLTYENTNLDIKDTGQTFEDWDNDDAGSAEYMVVVTNSDNTTSWGYLCQNITTPTTQITVYTKKDCTTGANGFNGTSPSGKTPVGYEVRKTDYQITGSMTVGAWVKSSSVPDTDAIISKFDQDASKRTFMIAGRVSSKPTAYYSTNGAGYAYITNDSGFPSIGDGVYHFLVFVYDSSSGGTLYFDGADLGATWTTTGGGSLTGALFDSEIPLTIASLHGSTVNYWNDTIDSPFVLDGTALTADQIKDVYNSTAAHYGLVSNNETANQGAANNSSSPTDDTSFHTFEVSNDSSNVVLVQDGTTIATSSSNLPNEDSYVRIQNADTTNALSLDWVGAAQYAASAPTGSTINATYISTNQQTQASVATSGAAPVAYWPLTSDTFVGQAEYAKNVMNRANEGEPPVLWMTMDDNDIDEHSCPGASGSGASGSESGSVAGACDVSGNGNHGTANGTMTDSDYVTGKIGPKALDFETDDYLDAGNEASLDITGSQITVAAWIKSSTNNVPTGARSPIVSKLQSGAAANGYNLDLADDSDTDGYRFIAVANECKFNATLSTDWKYVVGTYDGSNVKVYVDGVLVKTCAQTGNLNSSTSNVTIGRRLIDSSFFNGSLDEVKIYNYARSAEQIKSDYENTHAYFGAGSASPTWMSTNDSESSQILSFDGADDYLVVADPPSGGLDFGTGDMSIAVWVKSSSSGYQGIANKRRNASPYDGYTLMFEQDNTVQFAIRDSSGVQTNARSTATYNNGQWHHVVGALDHDSSTGQKLYVDGQLIDTENPTSVGSISNDVALNIGTWQGTLNPISGNISGLKLFPYALSAAQVKAEYAGSPFSSSAVAGTKIRMGGSSGLQSALSDGLVGYWRLDGDANDSSGNSNNGTLAGDTSFTAGKYSEAGSFDGTGDYVNVTDDDSLDMDGSLSIGFWMKATSWGDGQSRGVVDKKLNDSSNGYVIYNDGSVPANSINLRMKGTSGTHNFIYSSSNVTTGTWEHWTAVYDSSTQTAMWYKNGIFDVVFTSINPGDMSNGQATTVGYSKGWGGYFDGQIDDVRIYNRALTGDEVMELYLSGSSPVAQYKLDEDSGVTAADTGPYSFNTNFDVSTPLTSSNSLSWVPGKFGSAISLDGIDDYLETAQNTGGLVGWWKMDDGSGTTADDSVDTQNGTLTNGTSGSPPTWTTTAKFGSALTFTRTNKSYVDLGTNGTLCPTSVTLSGWFRRTETGYEHTIMGNWWSRWGQISVTTGNKLEWKLLESDGTTWHTLTSTSSVATNVWHYFSATMDKTSGTGYLYLNGIREDTETSITDIERPDCSFASIGMSGEDEANNPDWFNGQIDDVRIYNRALSENEIKKLYDERYLSPTGSVSLSAVVKPQTVGSDIVGGTIVSKGNNNQLSIINNQGSARTAFTTNSITTQLSGTSINDVYFYDTTKDDTDPDTWRFDSSKSWYSETIDATYTACNPATHDRCGNKEFPEKAYLIATASNVYIYDAEENAMWMRFDKGGTDVFWLSSNPTKALGYSAYPVQSVFALNGKIYVGSTRTSGEISTYSYGLFRINLSSDNVIGRAKDDGSGNYEYTWAGNISQRNSNNTWTATNTGGALVSGLINDVHAAYISSKQYVAVATDGGVSVINETDGTVVDDTSAGASVKKVFLLPNGNYYFVYNFALFYRYSIPGTDVSNTAYYNQNSTPYLGSSSTNFSLYVTQGTSTVDGTSNTIYLGIDDGLKVLQEKQGDEANGSAKYVTKDYITEEMVGDIRGMFPLNGTSGSEPSETSGAIDAADVNDADVTFVDGGTANNSSYADGIRGTGINFSGDDYLKQEVIDDETGASWGPTNHGISLAATAAFIRTAGVTLSTYASTGNNYMLVLTDSASKTAWGYIDTADVAEALGAELVTNGNMETGDPPSSWTGNNATLDGVADERTGGSGAQSLKIISDTTNGGAVQDISTTAGKLYKITYWNKSEAGSSTFQVTKTDWSVIVVSSSHTNTSWEEKTLYFTATDGTTRLRPSHMSGTAAYFDDVSVKEVTDVGTDGVHIMSTKGGATQSWASIESGFDYNDSSYTFEVRETEYQITGNLSFGAWVKPDDATNFWIITKRGGNYGYLMGIDGVDRFQVQIGDGTDYQTAYPTQTISGSTWYFLVGTYDGTNIKAYIDGELGATQAQDTPADTDTILRIGYDGGSFVNGTIDEPFVTAEALTASQIKHKYEVGKRALEADGTATLNGSSNQVNAVAAGGLYKYLNSSNSPLISSSRLYAGTEGGGVSEIDLSSDTLVNYWTTSTTPAINHANVNALTYTSGGTFVAALDSGASRLNSVSGRSQVPTGTWTGVAGVWDQTDGYYKLYEKGVLVGRTYVGTSHSPPTNSDKLTIGSTYLSALSYPSYPFYGSLDDVEVYTYALTARDANILAHGKSTPVLYLPFDLGYGSTATDRSPFSNDGTITNALWKDSGVKKRSLRFDGSGDYVNCGDNPTGVPIDDNERTISAWVRAQSLSDNTIAGWGADSIGQLSEVRLYSNKIQFHGYSNDISGATTLQANQWYHTAVAIKDGTVTIYLNGENDGTGSVTLDTLPLNCKVGRQPDYNGQYFKGDIDEVKIFPYQLSPSEIKREYNLGKSLVLGSDSANPAPNGAGVPGEGGDTEGLVLHLRMDDNVSGDAQTLVDASGNGNDGTTHYGANTTGMDCTVAGEYGYGCDFDGADDYVSVTDPGSNSSLDITDAISFAFWAKLDAYDGNFEGVLSKGQRNGDYNNDVWDIMRGGNMFRLHFNTATTIDATVTDETTWNHISFTYDGLQIKSFANGALINTLDYTEAISTDDNEIRVGHGYGSGSNRYLGGIVDDVKIYNRALTPTEIRNEYLYGPPPIAYWNMDENTGTTVYDRSENSNNSTTFSTPSWVPGKKGSGLQFNATSDYVLVTSSQLNNTGDFTASAWFKLAGVTYWHPILSNQTTTSPTNSTAGYNMQIQNTGNFNFFMGNGTTYGCDTGTTVTPSQGTWHYGTFTMNGTSGKLFLDGIQVGSCTFSGTRQSHNNTYIGYYANPENQYFNGLLDDVKIYNYALTPYQIAKAYNGGGPVGHWKFNEGSGQTLLDSSTAASNGSGGNDGTLGSSATDTTGDPDWVLDETSCKQGYCADFVSANSDYVDVAGDSTFYYSSDDKFTLSAWLNPDATNQGYPVALGGVVCPTQSGKFRYGFTISSGIIEFNVGANCISSENAQYTLNTGSWVHVVGVYDTSTIKLYMNGVEVNSTAYTQGSISAGTGDYGLNIGADGTVSGRFFDGKIDEVKVFNFALSPEDVAKDYNLGKALRF